MNRTNRPAAPRWGRLSLFAGLGVCLLGASFVVAGLSLYSRAGDPAPATKPSAPSPGKRAVVFGYVDARAGLTNLYPVQPGRVVEVLVKEGDSVEPGTPLYRLDDSLARAKVAQAKADLEAAKPKVEQARQAVAKHDYDVKALEAGLESMRRKLDVARALDAKAKRLKDQKLGYDEEVEITSGSVKELEEGIKAKEFELQGVKQIDPNKTVALAEAAVRGKQGQLDEAELALKECTVTARAKGTVLQLNVTPGEVIGTSPLSPTQTPRHPVVFCPAGPRVVRAEVNQEWANRAALGQTALIQDDSSATVTAKGRVVFLSDWYTHRRSTILEPLQFNDVRTMEAVIELDPDQPPLRIGQRVMVTLEAVN
jgi:multidrug resistance efflux pump